MRYVDTVWMDTNITIAWHNRCSAHGCIHEDVEQFTKPILPYLPIEKAVVQLKLLEHAGKHQPDANQSKRLQARARVQQQ